MWLLCLAPKGTCMDCSVDDIKNHPSLQDGKLTIYFESEETMQAFLETPVNHPYEHSLGRIPEDADRGG